MRSNSPVPSGAEDHSVTGGPGEALEPAARPFRRSFTAAHRAKVVAEYEAAPHGSKAAVLRREGLYQPQIRRRAEARDASNSGASPPRRAHRATRSGPAGTMPRGCVWRTTGWTRELAKSAAAVEIMGKLQGLLETVSESTGTPTSSKPR